MKKSRTGVFDPNLDKAFTSFGADIDLTAQSRRPAHEVERLEVHNDETTTQDIVITRPHPDGNVDTVYEIPADTIRVIRGPIVGIKTSGTGTIASAVAFWFWDGVAPLNP
jgi:hypothetical protein